MWANNNRLYWQKGIFSGDLEVRNDVVDVADFEIGKTNVGCPGCVLALGAVL